MRFQRIGLTLLALLSATTLMPVTLSLTAPPGGLRVLAQTTADRKAEADRLFNQGIGQLQTNRFQEALQSWQQALSIYREIHDRQNEGAVLGNLGNAYLYLSNYAKVIEYQQQALAIDREIHNRQGEGQDLGNLGIAYLSLGNYAKAIEYLEQRLTIAREINDRQGEGKALGNLGLAYYSLGNYHKAIEYYQQSLTIKREIHERDGEGTALNNLGLTLLKSHNLKEAERNLRAAIQVYENLRAELGTNDANKVSIFEQQASSYRTLQQVLIAENQPNAALEIAERGRARAFVELLAARVSSKQSAPTQIAPPTLQLLQQVAQQQQATLIEYSIIYHEFKPTFRTSKCSTRDYGKGKSKKSR